MDALIVFMAEDEVIEFRSIEGETISPDTAGYDYVYYGATLMIDESLDRP